MVGTIIIIYDKKWNYEGHFQVTGFKRDQNSAIIQGIVYDWFTAMQSIGNPATGLR
jgi:hypothetical protein